jgi:hypothetical protein
VAAPLAKVGADRGQPGSFDVRAVVVEEEALALAAPTAIRLVHPPAIGLRRNDPPRSADVLEGIRTRAIQLKRSFSLSTPRVVGAIALISLVIKD